MPAVKRKNAEIQLFIQQSNIFSMQNPDHPFRDKLLKQARRLRDINETYQEEARDAAIDNCALDDKGHILYDGEGDKRNYKFTKEGLKEYNKAVKLIGEKIVSFDLVINKEQLTKMEQAAKEYFEFFIIGQ